MFFTLVEKQIDDRTMQEKWFRRFRQAFHKMKNAPNTLHKQTRICIFSTFVRLKSFVSCDGSVKSMIRPGFVAEREETWKRWTRPGVVVSASVAAKLPYLYMFMSSFRAEQLYFATISPPVRLLPPFATVLCHRHRDGTEKMAPRVR